MGDLTTLAMIGVGVALAVAMVAVALAKPPGEAAERRLEGLTSARPALGPSRKADSRARTLLRPQALDPARAKLLARLLPSLDGLARLCEQADVNLNGNKFLGLVAALAAVGAGAGWILGLPLALVPVGAVLLGALPPFWLVRRKKSRIRKYLKAMPEAMDLLGRALRAGHGLASGMNLVAEETKGPLAEEFGRVFEEQNLGIPPEVALRGMADRVPSMDVRFFVTAVVIQRATGGDLAEVLDKIGRLIRQRFELHGHVKALTAEGRLSGLVLLALPPALLAFLTMSNYNYVSVLFTTTVGSKLLGITFALQVIGALAIRKIVAIKV